MATTEGMRAVEMTRMVTKELLTALKYIPDEKLDWVPMGSAKTPRAIIVECGAGYKWLAAELRGDENAAQAWENAQAASYPTRDTLREFIEASEAELAAAIDGLTEDQLDEKRKVFWGEETLRNLLWMGVMHTNYHVGQLNYIQTLWGDTEMHHA